MTCQNFIGQTIPREDGKGHPLSSLKGGQPPTQSVFSREIKSNQCLSYLWFSSTFSSLRSTIRRRFVSFQLSPTTTMSKSPRCTVFIGNLDERVSERVLYDILIQAGRVVDMYIPRDKETDKPKGYAFAEYESQEIADYAIKLFSGVVTLYNRTLRFALSGQDKNSQNSSSTNNSSSSRKSRTDPVPVPVNNMENSHQSTRISALSRVSVNPASIYSSQEPPPPGVTVTHQSNGYGTHNPGTNYDYTRRVFGETLDCITHSRSRHYDSNNSASYPYY